MDIRSDRNNTNNCVALGCFFLWGRKGVSRTPDVGLEDLLVSEERGATNRAGFIWDTHCSNLIVRVSRFFIFGRRCGHKEPVQDTQLPVVG
jgi:hypothetical protein